MKPSVDTSALASAYETGGDSFAVAEAFAAAGFAVFPLKEGSKAPANPHGHKEATTDTDTITGWFSGRDGLGVGVVPASGGCVVADLDVKKGVDGVASFEKHAGVPASRGFVVGTPSGGKHLWFSSPGGVGSGRDVYPGVDWRSGRGYVAVHPGYTLLTGGYIPAAPPAFVAAVTTPTPHTPVREGVVLDGWKGVVTVSDVYEHFRPGEGGRSAVSCPNTVGHKHGDAKPSLNLGVVGMLSFVMGVGLRATKAGGAAGM